MTTSSGRRRTVAVVTTSRADYGHLRWVLEEIRAHPALELRLVALGSHLAATFGRTVDEAVADGFAPDERIECLLDSDSDVGMAKTIGVATLSLADALDRLRPDLLLLIADRYEMLAPASVALALRIPVAHIEGGEISEGAIDDMVRHALTKLAHLHFTPTETARRRVLALGEEPWRVYRTGAPSLDHLRRSELLDGQPLATTLGHGIEADATLVSYHPVTIARDTLREADAVFDALGSLDRQWLFCFPNADAGSRALIERARAFCAARPRARLHVNLNPVVYWSLLRRVSLMVGNSSSGIMEAPSLRLPTVDVGMRQRGRERARSIVHADARGDEIVAAIERAISAEFRESLDGMANPYGDGHASERIAIALAEVPLGESLLVKRGLVDVG